MGRTKKRTYEILEKAPEGDLASWVFDISIMVLISLNVLAVILETVEILSVRYSSFFHLFEVFSVIVFTVEYGLRLWSCNIDKRFQDPVFGRIRFALTFMALVDLFAILPFYLPMLIPCDLRFLRALRLIRLFRLLKIGRYTESLNVIGRVVQKKKEEIIITAFTVLMLLILASSMIYLVEHDAQPEVFSSIPAAMWWGVATLTTVGYGDVYPITILGKILGAIVALLGIGLFALPTGILASGFMEEIKQKTRTDPKRCPHCGEDIENL